MDNNSPWNAVRDGSSVDALEGVALPCCQDASSPSWVPHSFALSYNNNSLADTLAVSPSPPA
jgi:hypothetical protein